jgi:hypothetical protein
LKQNNLTRFLINASRGIIYKSPESDFTDKARAELLVMNKIINSIMNE